MSLNKLIPVGCVILGMVATLGIAATDASLEGVKCLMVSSKDANKEKSAKWKKGEVFFCCNNCLGKFSKLDDEGKKKIAPKANHQLVASKQYAQECCPMSGQPINDDEKITVSGAEIAFCCGNCKGKAEKMEDDEQIAELFSEKAFKMAKFEPVKK